MEPQIDTNTHELRKWIGAYLCVDVVTKKKSL